MFKDVVVLRTRRSIMNLLLVVLLTLVTIVGAFEFGKYWATKDQFIEPDHFLWNALCADKGNDQRICSCLEKEMIKDFGRSPINSKNNDNTVVSRAFEKCIKLVK